MPFRVAIGTCGCEKPYRDSIERMACEAIDSRLSDWRPRLPADLCALPRESYELERVKGYWVTSGSSKHVLPSGETLVVFAVLVHTWSRPTYISFGAIGRMYAEGLLVSSTGEVTSAPDEVMWEFR